MTPEQVATALEAVATGLEIAPSPVAKMAAGLLRLGASLARRGLEPVEHLTRLVDLNPELDRAAAMVDSEADRKYRGESGDAVSPGGQDPEGNPYDP